MKLYISTLQVHAERIVRVEPINSGTSNPPQKSAVYTADGSRFDVPVDVLHPLHSGSPDKGYLLRDLDWRFEWRSTAAFERDFVRSPDTDPAQAERRRAIVLIKAGMLESALAELQRAVGANEEPTGPHERASDQRS